MLFCHVNQVNQQALLSSMLHCLHMQRGTLCELPQCATMTTAVIAAAARTLVVEKQQLLATLCHTVSHCGRR